MVVVDGINAFVQIFDEVPVDIIQVVTSSCISIGKAYGIGCIGHRGKLISIVAVGQHIMIDLVCSFARQVKGIAVLIVLDILYFEGIVSTP